MISHFVKFNAFIYLPPDRFVRRGVIWMERIIVTIRATTQAAAHYCLTIVDSALYRSVAIRTCEPCVHHNLLQPASVPLRKIIDKRIISEVLFHWFAKIMKR